MGRSVRNYTGGYTATDLTTHLAAVPGTLCVCWLLTPQGTLTAPRDARLTWQNLTGLRKEANDLVCDVTGVNAWTAGASSVETFSGEGGCKFRFVSATAYAMAGLAFDDATRSYTDIDFAWSQDSSNGLCYIYENGTQRTSFPLPASGPDSVYEMRRVWDGILNRYRIDYLIDGVWQYTSPVNPTTGALRIDTSFNTIRTTKLAQVYLTQTSTRALGFTTHTRDLTLPGHSGVVFRSARGMKPTVAEQQAGLAAPNIEVDAIFTDDGVTEADVNAGYWDEAEYEAFVINYAAPNMGELVVQAGRVGELRALGQLFKAEGLGLAARTQQQVGELTLGTCRVRKFGDARCGLNAATYTSTSFISGTVSAEPNTEFYATALAQAENYFANGDLTFTSGRNAGFETEVRLWNIGGNQKFTLHQPTPYPIEAGASFTVVAGCDRLPETCRDKFANKINFQGEDTIPGIEAVVRRPQPTV